jgi:hypothetical protein
MALLAIRPRSSVALSNFYRSTRETRPPLVTLLMRIALVRTTRIYQASRVYLFPGQTPKFYWRKLRARTGRSGSLIMVLLFFTSAIFTLKLPIIPVVDTKVTPIWNPIGVIPGYIKDEVVLVGNHRDGKC